MKKMNELLKKLDQVERAGGSLKHLSLTNSGFRNINDGQSEPNDNQYMCELIWASNQSYTEWDTTREGALEKSLNALFNYHGDIIRFHKNNLNPFNNK
jgi:heme-degrading monooxygenase HmoA